MLIYQEEGLEWEGCKFLALSYDMNEFFFFFGLVVSTLLIHSLKTLYDHLVSFL